METSFVSVFIREQKRYTKNDLCKELQCTQEELVVILRYLKQFDVVKSVKYCLLQKTKNDLFDEDIEFDSVEIGNDDYLYVFTFVGIVIVKNYIFKCYPKYILSNNSPLEQLQQVLKVIEKYNTKKQIIHFYNSRGEINSFNRLGVMLFLLKDYYDNGIYTNEVDILEDNGNGEICWDKTINETFAFLSANRPYYTNIQTHNRKIDEYDYFKRIHECIITTISKELKDANLLQIFELTDTNISSETIEQFGDTDYILYKIDKELNIQFNTRKKLVLKTIYSFLSNNCPIGDDNCLSLFGTNSFNLVWENVCSEIMDNQLYKFLTDIKLPQPLNHLYLEKPLKLIDLIDKPFWSYTKTYANDTLIPDIVSIFFNDIKSYFIIFDAKYYNPILEENSSPKSQPGIESITKQYLYQLSFNDFIVAHNFDIIANCFLFPTEKDKVDKKGIVSLKMFQKFSEVKFQDIKNIFIPAETAYKQYLRSEKFNILNELDL